jgi:hypothetical protein
VAEHDAGTLAAMPPFPVNGHGNLVPDFPSADRAGAHQWIMGSTFERDVTELPPTAADQQAAHASNGEKLAALLPGCRQALRSFFDAEQRPATWARLRCAAYDRLPLAPCRAVGSRSTGPVGADGAGLTRADAVHALRRAAGGTPAWRAAAAGCQAGSGPGYAAPVEPLLQQPR